MNRLFNRASKKLLFITACILIAIGAWLLRGQDTVITSGNLTVSGIRQETDGFTLYADGRGFFAGGSIVLGTDGGLTGGFNFAGDHITVTGDGAPLKLRGLVDNSANLLEFYRGSDSNLMSYINPQGVFTGNGSGLNNLNLGGSAFTNSITAGTGISLSTNTGTITIANTASSGYVAGDSPVFNSLSVTGAVSITNVNAAGVPVVMTLQKGTANLFEIYTNRVLVMNMSSNGVLNVSNNIFSGGTSVLFGQGGSTYGLSYASSETWLVAGGSTRLGASASGVDMTVASLNWLSSGVPDTTLSRVSAGSLLLSTNLTAKGLITSTNGFANYRSNLLAAASITVGASPFNWTNTIGVDVMLYVDGVSVTGSESLNGTLVYNTIGQNALQLHPNDYATITYTLGTPTAWWRP